MSSTLNAIDFSLKYKVKDMSLAEWGRKEIRLAEMPPRSTKINANNSDSGIISVTSKAAKKRLKKTNKIINISTAPSIML